MRAVCTLPWSSCAHASTSRLSSSASPACPRNQPSPPTARSDNYWSTRLSRPPKTIAACPSPPAIPPIPTPHPLPPTAMPMAPTPKPPGVTGGGGGGCMVSMRCAEG